MDKDYYKTLGVERAAGVQEIKKAYRRLARKYHPDLNPGDKTAEARFKEIQEAYSVLSDPKKKAQYGPVRVQWGTVLPPQLDGPTVPDSRASTSPASGRPPSGTSSRTCSDARPARPLLSGKDEGKTSFTR